MSTSVLFMCPHSAGKSLAAATYFRAAAARRGLDVSIQVAGPEPDPENMPNVVEALTAQGYSIGWNPVLVSEDHTAAADLMISIGCDHTSLPTTNPVIEWDVPMISADLAASLQAIFDRAEGLAAEMVEAAT